MQTLSILAEGVQRHRIVNRSEQFQQEQKMTTRPTTFLKCFNADFFFLFVLSFAILNKNLNLNSPSAM